jgi:predicted nucleotidyltransferase
MAKKTTLPGAIQPYIKGYLVTLEQLGVPIKEAYLFGSWAKGTQHRWSDIDVAVISPVFSSFTKKLKYLARAGSYSDFAEIEGHGFAPQDFADPNNPIVYEIKKYGVKIV